MIEKRQLVLNAAVSIVQVVVVGVTFFFLYKYLLDAIGETDFGVWAVVLATTSAGSVANLGLAGGSTKYVARYLAREDEVRVRQVIETATISVAVALGLLLMAAFPLFRLILGYVIEAETSVSKAYAILPYSLCSFWLTSVSMVFQASIDGFQRIDLRGVIVSVTAVIYLAIAYVLVPRSGLIGIAQAQVIQSAVLCVASWGILKTLFSRLPLLPGKWTKDVFTEMLSYSLNLQINSIFRILVEPTTGALLSKFGGVSVVAYYEMARRMVVQLRALFVTAQKSIVPAIADLHEREPERIRQIYIRSFQVLSFLIAPTLPFLIGATPLISEIWVGSYSGTFIAFSILLLIGWFLNMGGNPAYYANVGTGELRWNVIGHIVIGVLNLALGILLGWLFGGIGVVIGFVLALLAGSSVVAIAYEIKYRVGLTQIVHRGTATLALGGFLGMILMFGIYVTFDHWNIALISGGALVAYGLVVLGPIWTHPLRVDVLDWIRLLLAGKGEPAQQ